MQLVSRCHADLAYTAKGHSRGCTGLTAGQPICFAASPVTSSCWAAAPIRLHDAHNF